MDSIILGIHDSMQWQQVFGIGCKSRTKPKDCITIIAIFNPILSNLHTRHRRNVAALCYTGISIIDLETIFIVAYIHSLGLLSGRDRAGSRPSQSVYRHQAHQWWLLSHLPFQQDSHTGQTQANCRSAMPTWIWRKRSLSQLHRCRCDRWIWRI